MFKWCSSLLSWEWWCGDARVSHPQLYWRPVWGIPCLGASSVLYDVQHHPWPVPTTCPSIDSRHHLATCDNQIVSWQMSLGRQTCLRVGTTETDFKVLRELEQKLWEMRQEERKLICETENEHGSKWAESGLPCIMTVRNIGGPCRPETVHLYWTKDQDLHLRYFILRHTAMWLKNHQCSRWADPSSGLLPAKCQWNERVREWGHYNNAGFCWMLVMRRGRERYTLYTRPHTLLCFRIAQGASESSKLRSHPVPAKSGFLGLASGFSGLAGV